MRNLLEKRTGHAHPDEPSWQHNSFDDLDYWQSSCYSTYRQDTQPPFTSLLASSHQPPLTNMQCQYTQPPCAHTNPQSQFASTLASTQPHLTLLALHSLPNFQALLSMNKTYKMVSQVACRKHYLFAQNAMQLPSPLTTSAK